VIPGVGEIVGIEDGIGLAEGEGVSVAGEMIGTAVGLGVLEGEFTPVTISSCVSSEEFVDSRGVLLSRNTRVPS
jgi:hypothetical protein